MRNYYVRFQAKALLNKKPLHKGDLIVSSEPFAFVINNSEVSKYCGYCLLGKRLMNPCKKCMYEWYCSEGCQRLAWDVHKFECHPLKRMQPEVPSAFVRLIARIIFKLKNGGDKIVEKYNEQKEGRKFRDLMNHYADVKKDPEAKKEIDELIPQLKKYIGKDNLPNFSDVLGIYGRVLVNRFCLFDNMMMTFGSGVYLAASIFDHACVPNCYVSFSGKRVQIRSLIDMQELDYNKLRIGYLDPVCSVATRKAELYRKWFFWCDCKTCADTDRRDLENSVICDTEGCETKVYIPEEYDLKDPNPTCKSCGTSVDTQNVRMYRETVIYTKKFLMEMSEEDPCLQDCLEILERQGDIFHPLNVWKVRTLDFTFNSCVFNGCWSLALDYGDQNYEGMRYYYGDSNPTFAMFLHKLGKAKIYVQEMREGIDLLDKAESVLRIGLGPNHPLIVNELIPTSLLANMDSKIWMERMHSSDRLRKRYFPS